MSTAPAIVREDVPLDRLTTVRTGGHAQYFARAAGEQELRALLAWATAAGLSLRMIGSGSNLLVADSGVPGLVCKLDRGLAAIETHGERAVCGAGARLPSVAATLAGAGLAGLEFGVNIPGTVGGAVRMNANAYGGELAAALEWVDVLDAQGSSRRPVSALGLSYRSSSIAPAEVIVRAGFRLVPGSPVELKASLADLRARRRLAQPSGIKTFGSTFKNPRDPRAEGRSAGLLLAAVDANGLAIGGARFAVKHANFVENMGTATTEDVVAVMAEGRRRVLERFGVALEAEVQTLGDVRFPWAP